LRLDAGGLGECDDHFALLRLDAAIGPGDKHERHQLQGRETLRRNPQLDEAIQHGLVADSGNLGQLLAPLHLLQTFLKGLSELLVLLIKNGIEKNALAALVRVRHNLIPF